MLFGGIALLIVATICFFVARSNAGKLHAMNAAETYTAQLLGEVHRKIAASLGADALAQACEVEGVIECEAPLKGPLSGQACVAYAHTVTREYEQRVTSTDSAGKRETKVERRSEQVQSDERRTNFFIRDATGRTLVIPEGAEIDMLDSGNRFDAEEKPWSGDTRSLGRRHAERFLPVGTKVYVLGTAVDHQGAPALAQRPKQRFMISRKSERELAGSAAGWARGLYITAGASGAIGVILVIADLIM